MKEYRDKSLEELRLEDYIANRKGPKGTSLKFQAVCDHDVMVKDGQQQNINTRHQNIEAMKEYQEKSIEELRLDDYIANRKGPWPHVSIANKQTVFPSLGFKFKDFTSSLPIILPPPLKLQTDFQRLGFKFQGLAAKLKSGDRMFNMGSDGCGVKLVNKRSAAGLITVSIFFCFLSVKNHRVAWRANH